MKFNGMDPTTLHPAISIAKEIYPSMPAREIATVETANGDLVSNVSMVQDEAVIRINIAAKTYEEAMQARMWIAGWAGSSGKYTAELEPTRTPGFAYEAIVKRIGKIENRFSTIDVVFLLPKPTLHAKTESTAEGSGAGIVFVTEGTAPVQPVFALTPDETTEGLVILVDGRMLLALKGTLYAGEKVEYDLQTGAVTIAGVHAENRILYTEIDPDIELLPGEHTVNVSAVGDIQVRWRNEWL